MTHQQGVGAKPGYTRPIPDSTPLLNSINLIVLVGNLLGAFLTFVSGLGGECTEIDFSGECTSSSVNWFATVSALAYAQVAILVYAGIRVFSEHVSRGVARDAARF